MIEGSALPNSSYSYAAISGRLGKNGIKVSTTTIIKRAISQDYDLPKRMKRVHHDREVITSAVGDLIQHDASIYK